MANNLNLAAVQNKATEKINVSSIGNDLILTQLKNIRSNWNLSESDNTTQSAQAQQFGSTESYCHAFYRVIGLPVISSNKTDFYNPGFVNDETSEERERKLKIDQLQDSELLKQEILREQICSYNIFAFENVSELKLKYQLDMMIAPIPILMMDQNLKDPFTVDTKQIIAKVEDRNTFKSVAKILRPFKCVPYIANNISPRTNMICAPFIIDNDAKIHNNQISHSYLEFVAAVRFLSDIKKTKDSNLYKSLSKTLSQLGSFDFDNSAKKLSDVEYYIFTQLFTSFISICKAIRDTKINNAILGNELYLLSGGEIITDSQGQIELSDLDRQIAEKKTQIGLRNLIFAQLPTATTYSDGMRLSNTINCILTSSFVSFIQGDIASLEKELNELENNKKNQLEKFDSIDKTSFYVLGEVNGIGLIDMMAIMMALWLLPQDIFLGLFDGPSFERLYKYTGLHNSVVEARYKATKFNYSSIKISDALKSMDNLILNLLMIASNIVDTDINN